MEIIQNIKKEVTKVTVPDWISGNAGLKELAALGTGGAATLVAFAEDPEAFIIGTILEVFVGFILDGAALLIDQLESAWEPIAEIPATVGQPIVDGGAGVMSAVLDAVGTVDTAVQTVIGAAGPAAPIITVLITAVGIVVALYLARLLVYEILPLVIPWL